MKNYMCAYYSSVNGEKIKYEIFASDPEDAVEQLIETFPNTKHRAIRITGQGMKKLVFQNPNYAQPEPCADGAKDLRARLRARSDGSAMTEKQILLAQLAELRTIKRCVVSTVVIVIVIPLIVGVIVSG